MKIKYLVEYGLLFISIWINRFDIQFFGESVEKFGCLSYSSTTVWNLLLLGYINIIDEHNLTRSKNLDRLLYLALVFSVNANELTSNRASKKAVHFITMASHYLPIYMLQSTRTRFSALSSMEEKTNLR